MLKSDRRGAELGKELRGSDLTYRLPPEAEEKKKKKEKEMQFSGANNCSPSPFPPYTDMPARGNNVSCSPETSAQVSCCTLDGRLLRPKERDSPAPPAAQPTSLQVIQLAPSPTSLGCRPHPEHSPVEQLGGTPCPSTTPPLLRRRRTHLDLPAEPSLDFLQVQRETAEAIRELTYTLRQGLERLTDVVAALLPLLPVQANPLLHQQGETVSQGTSTEASPLRDTFITKVEPCPEQGEELARPLLQEEGRLVAEPGQTTNQVPAPQKRRKGIPTRKRRGRWRNL